MAKAIMTSVDDSYCGGDGKCMMAITVMYAGGDVPGTFQKQSLDVDISGVTSVATLGTTLAAAIRGWAASNTGYTVPASSVFLPSYTNL